MKSNIQLKTNRIDKLLEMIGLLVVLLSFVFSVWIYFHVPEQIPTHFGSSGRPDSYGGKTSIFIAPIVSALAFVFLTIIDKYPNIYYVTTSREPAIFKYISTRRFYLVSKIVIAFVFFYVLLSIYLAAHSTTPQ